ncbi:MAG: hypothetical protein FWD49_01945 [Firmicutes bacterium]|nr:hypothetical protein [Bacillota bacterium]
MKKLNEKQKKILDIVLIALQVIIIITGITISAILIANPNPETNRVSKSPVKLLPVLSDSMAGSGSDNFKKGDLLIARNAKNNGRGLEAQVKDENGKITKQGDIITFHSRALNILITHRIVGYELDGAGNVRGYITQGDANSSRDSGFVTPQDVLAVYDNHLKGVGSAISWLQKPTSFIFVIVVPLALLMFYNIFLLVRMVMHHRMAVAQEEADAKAEESIAQAEASLEDKIEKMVAERLAKAEAVKSAEAREVEPKE